MLEDNRFDPTRWAMTADPEPTNTSAAELQREPSRRRGRFLKGPVPWPWLLQAMKLPGKALAIGLMIWLKCGITKRDTVHFCLREAEEAGISTKAARLAIQQLEADGLIEVQRLPGRGLDVTILKAEECEP